MTTYQLPFLSFLWFQTLSPLSNLPKPSICCSIFLFQKNQKKKKKRLQFPNLSSSSLICKIITTIFDLSIRVFPFFFFFFFKKYSIRKLSLACFVFQQNQIEQKKHLAVNGKREKVCYIEIIIIVCGNSNNNFNIFPKIYKQKKKKEKE